MKTDFLKGLGLSDDVIAKIQAESGKDVEAEKISIHTLRVESDSKTKQDLFKLRHHITQFKQI